MSRDPRRLRDALVVVRCQLGEPDAFDELVERWHRPLGSFLRRLTGDPETTAELIQETWLGILRGLPRLRQPEQFPAWAFRIARDTLASRLRKQYQEPAETIDPEGLPGDGPEPDRSIDHERLESAVGELPVPEREAVVLFHLQELRLEEVAAITGVPVGTVKSRLYRARRNLRSRLEEPPTKGEP